MRKKLFVTIAILILAGLILSACSGTTFTVTFDVDGQTYLVREVQKGGTAELPQPPLKTGYVFDNWYLDKDVWTQPFKADTVVINNVTVYARWIRTVTPVQNTFIISFDSQGGSSVNAIRVKDGETFSLPENPTRQDYNFGGWFLDTAFTVPFTTAYKPTKNITVYAKWTAVDSKSYFKRSGSTITEITGNGLTAKTIVLPTEIDGIKITALGEGLFRGNKNLTKISFPKDSAYTTIGKECFKDCVNLVDVNVINGISTISEGAFAGCTSLTGINLPTSLTTIAKDTFNGCTALKYANLQMVEVDAIGDGAYSGCKSLLGPIKIYESVKRIGKEAFKGCSQVSAFDIEDGVTEIGDSAFYNCAKITAINIPDTVISLGTNVFYGCAGATTAYVGKGITAIPDYTFFRALKLDALTISPLANVTAIGQSAFAYCEELENFDIPSGVTTIGANAFNGCKDITSVTIPTGVTKIEQQAFMNTILLNTVNLHSGVTELGTASFMNCGELVTINGMTNVTKIGSAVFSACKKLESIVLPAGLTTIKDSAFEDCIALKNVVISDGIETIDKSAFSGCVALAEITLPLTLKSIGDYAFEGCTKLNGITLNRDLERISSTAFDNCTALTNISVDASNDAFEAENGVIYTAGKQKLVFYSDALESKTFVVPDSVKGIAEYVFYNNENLTSVTLPDTLEVIEKYAFSGCVNLATLNFPRNLASIGEYAFSSTKLESATLPIGLHTIDQNAFKGTTMLLTATMPITLVSVGKEIFYSSSPLLKITVEGDEDALSGWSGDWSKSGRSEYKIIYGQNRVTSGNGEYQYFVRDDRAVLTEYRGTATEVVVPATIDGRQVYGLYKTFLGNDKITDLVVPDCVKVISEMTLKGMTALARVTLPFAGAYRGADGVEGLFGYVFDYSENSKDEWIEQYAEGGSKAKYYVEMPKSITKVTLTDAVVIAYGAFSNVHNLTEIVLPTCVTTIKGRAFYHCSLETVTLPISLLVIEKEAFTYNFNRYQNITPGSPSPTVTFNAMAAERPSGWVEDCFDAGSIVNYATHN